MLGDHVERLGREVAGRAHPDKILRSMDGDASRVRPAVHNPCTPSASALPGNPEHAQPDGAAQGQYRARPSVISGQKPPKRLFASPPLTREPLTADHDH
jgi:hypothetical protein